MIQAHTFVIASKPSAQRGNPLHNTYYGKPHPPVSPTKFINFAGPEPAKGIVLRFTFMVWGAYNPIIMNLESVGILVNLRPLNERDSLAHIFTYDFGIMCGVLRGAIVARKNKPLVGQVGAVSWNARLDSQVGAFHWEPARNLAAPLMMSRSALAYMNAARDLIITLLPEREKYDTLYNETIYLLENLGANNAADIYLQWEINLLRDLGYALDLSRCSGCGRSDNLHWLSPRTGRAVCDDCAAPYINKLYKLPVDLNTTLCFIERVCDGVGAQIPSSRRLLKIEK